MWDPWIGMEYLGLTKLDANIRILAGVGTRLLLFVYILNNSILA